MVSVETKRWARFLGRSARSDLLVVSTHRTEKRGQRAGIGGKHPASYPKRPDVERKVNLSFVSRRRAARSVSRWRAAWELTTATMTKTSPRKLRSTPVHASDHARSHMHDTRRGTTEPQI